MKSIIKLVRNNIIMLKASHMLKVVFLVFFIAVTLLSVFFRLTIKSVNRLELFSEVIGIFGGIILIILAFLSLYLIFYPKILNLEQLFLTRPITKKVYFISKILVSLIILILLIFILIFVSYSILLTGTSYFWQGETIATLLIKIANVSLVGVFLMAIIYFTSALFSSIYLNFAIFFIIYLGGEILKTNIY
ncbi:ABC transporter permease, partial [Streptococcus dysgalactiae]|uniref:ABC transporter permease n=2 Tax=Streptococcus dysgalactiae TaxID=1334 RepID=UPI0012DF5CBF